MSKENNLKDFLTDIADAVREKKGTTEPINAQNLSEEIRGIESGGDNPWRADVTWLTDGEFGFDSMSEVAIHEGVTTIGERAFRYNSSITKLTLPSTLKSIKAYGISGMTKLSEVNLPAGFTEVILDGGCHAYFGMYGPQDGDGTPTISNEDQIYMTAHYIDSTVKQAS